MLETGQSGKLLYRQVAELVHSRGVEKIIGVGEEIRTAAARFEIEKYFFRTTEERRDIKSRAISKEAKSEL